MLRVERREGGTRRLICYMNGQTDFNNILIYLTLTYYVNVEAMCGTMCSSVQIRAIEKLNESSRQINK